jgi:23S rRNA pseudouridine1911/1915/1917 synthase
MSKSSTSLQSRILFEDNHLIIINKLAGELVQGDRTNDETLADKVKAYIKLNENKPGAVYLGIPHRLDRPVSGVVIYTKTSKALSRMSELFRLRNIQKIYWAISDSEPKTKQGQLTHFMGKNDKQNKSYTSDIEKPGYKEAVLNYRVLSSSDRYHLLEVELETGRHHQIRAQLASINCIIKGDLKYGAKRSNSDASIHLHSRKTSFTHPIKKTEIAVTAPCPEDSLWNYFESELEGSII